MSVDRFTTGQVVNGRYHIVKRLGAGAFGAVYLVEDLELDSHRFALKVLRLGFDEDKDQSLVERFRTEARRGMDLVHPCIVQVKHYFKQQDQGLYCFVLDYVEGAPLGELWRKDGDERKASEVPAAERRLALPRALARVREVLEALDHAHDKGLLHRDIKPENVLVAHVGTERERARVLDFGIAKEALEGGAYATIAGMGTPAYMAPEQASGSFLDARTDVYAVGTTLYELLTGMFPYDSLNAMGFTSQKLIEKEPIPIRERAPDLALPQDVEALVMRALAIRPEDRFASARAMIDAIDALGIAPGARRDAWTSAHVAAARAPASGAVAAALGFDWGAPPEGQVVGRYTIRRVIGEGGFGVVCEAEQHGLLRRVALKILRPEVTEEPTFAERFRREGQVLSELGHPALPAIYDLGEQGGTSYMAIELLDGETLADRLGREWALDVATLVDILRPVAAALDLAHARAVIHRDLKPENIFLLRDGRVKLLDFGIAQLAAVSERLTRHGQVLGTLSYLSPEQARGEPLDGRSDVYALGVLAFEALTGRLPFEHEDDRALVRAHQEAAPPRLSDMHAGGDGHGHFPDAVEAAIACALAKERDARFATTSAFVDALAAAIAPAAPTLEAARARIDLPPGAIEAAGGLTSIFVVSGPALRLGRSRPGQMPPGTPDNDLVLRVLPCRMPPLDPENNAATRMISSSHVRLEAHGADLVLTDTSTYGTWLDGRRIPGKTPEALPDTFELGIAEVLTLEGHVLRRSASGAPAGERDPVHGLLLLRRTNWSQHAYLWVVGEVDLGGEGRSAVPLPAGLGGRAAAHGGLLRIWASADLSVQPYAAGDERLAG